MKISKEEYNYLFENLNRMLDELNKNASSLYNSKNIILPQNMVSQKTLYQIIKGGYIPGRGTVSKIVDFFNANFRPETTLYEILNTSLFSEKRTRIIHNKGERYIGKYWIYYLSDNYKNEIHGGILNIFNNNKFLYANLIMGLCEDSQFEIAENIINKGTTSAHVNQLFLKYRSHIIGDNREKLENCYFCEGPVHVLPRSVNMELVNSNSTEYLMYISLNIDSDTASSRYIGGLPVYMSPACGVLQTRICQMCMVRVDYNRKHRVFSLQDSRLYNYLKMEPTNFHRFESTISKAKQFQHMLNEI